MDQYLRLPRSKGFFAAALAVAIVSTALLFWLGKPELVPQLWISVIVAILSYWACSFTAEKLRLDLFDRRFEIYSKTLAYCSAVMTHASLEANERNKDDIRRAIDAAHESFRGIGYHKTRALFGPDIVKLFDELNSSYAYIATWGGREDRRGYDADKYWGYVNRTVEIATRLPEYFARYVYFGDHKQL
jgi:hypothetical protein